MNNHLHRILFCCLVAAPISAFGEVKMPGIFGDHMVLQQDAKIPVWGWAAPDEKVTVTLGSANSAAVTADAKGNWRVNLTPMPEDKKGTPLVMTVAGSNTITFQDVVVGDVWIASGQSNMELGISNVDGGPEAVAQANEPGLRFFNVPHVHQLEPLKDISADSNGDLMGKWVICTPEMLQKVGTPWNGFSAIGYFFGREIQHNVGHPVAIVGAYWGGTPCQAWVSLEGLSKDPELAHYVEDHKRTLAELPQKQAEYPAVMKKYNEDKAAWEKYQADSKALPAGSPPLPKPPGLNGAPPWPTDPNGGPGGAAHLFNGVINPIIPFAVKGVIWYQGEGNAQNQASGIEYGTLFPAMIKDWREHWGQGDFPFLLVELANFTDPAKTPSEGGWAWLREGQHKALALPNTAMASAIDIGNAADIHPKDKIDVAKRLVLAAKNVAYGDKTAAAAGPTYDSMKVDGNKIVISFKNAEGLKIAAPPWLPNGGTPQMPTEVSGFGIAGADKNFVWAKAEIQGDKVVVWADSVTAPVSIRYGWTNNPAIDLYNAAGLPAVPFRTDDWQ